MFIQWKREHVRKVRVFKAFFNKASVLFKTLFYQHGDVDIYPDKEAFANASKWCGGYLQFPCVLFCTFVAELFFLLSLSFTVVN